MVKLRLLDHIAVVGQAGPEEMGEGGRCRVAGHCGCGAHGAVSIVPGAESGRETFALAGKPSNRDGRMILFVGAEAVSRAQSIARELNALERDGSLPAEWELRCR